MKLSERVERVELERSRARASAPGPRRRTPDASWGRMKRSVRDALIESLGPKLAQQQSLAELEALVARHLDDALHRAGVSVPVGRRHRFVAEVAADILGYGPLDPLLADAEVTEVMCNAFDEIWVERHGKLSRSDAAFTDEAHLRQVIDKIVASVGRRIDEQCPMVDARLPDGSRVNAIIPPVAVRSPVLTIRRFPAEPYEVKDLIGFGTLTVDAAVFVEACVRDKRNIVVSGGTGTGKTTLLNVVSGFIPEGERVVTIEDAAELRLRQPHVVPLESRPPNVEGAGEVTIRDLVRNALRMRPDRIVVGEVRGGEALDMLQAMNTGHEGSLTTVHANSPRDALARVETMVLMAGFDLPLRAIRQQLASAVDLLVHLDRMPDGGRRVTHVCEVQGMEGDIVTLQDIFRIAGGRLRATGLRPANLSVAPKVLS